MAMTKKAKEIVQSLRENVSGFNFVYTVGYALEKVHSGLLGAVLNSEAGAEVASRLWNLNGSGGQRIPAGDVTGLEVARECPTGRRGVVDLVASFTNKQSGKKCHIVCEYKVDGTGNHAKQCETYMNNWNQAHEGEDSRYRFITAGGARFWKSPKKPFQQVDIPELMKLLEPAADIPLVSDYIAALQDELDRAEIAPEVGDQEDAPLGYRGYDWYYAYYDHLRKQLECAQEWSIYSGGHNAVMNWTPSWTREEGRGARKACELGVAYCEFNNRPFVLKMAWDPKPSKEDVERFYDAVERTWTIPEKHGFKRCRRSRQPKEYTSIAAMGFEDPTDLGEIARKVQAFVSNDFWPWSEQLENLLE